MMIKQMKTIFSIVVVLLCGQVFAQQNIYVNQVGYGTHLPKKVYVDYPADSFEVVNVKTGELAFKSIFKLRKADDKCSGMTIYEGNFSALTNPGRYMVRVFSPANSGISSYAFTISDEVYSNMLSLANTSLYLQRCGLDMHEKYAGKYARKICHTDNAIYHHTCLLKGDKDMTGGWHDAGDYGKYIAPGAVTIAILYASYELNKEKMAGDNWNIPESGNGVPDVLDEIRYELNWMFKMQRHDGAVHEKIHTKQYVQFVMPSEGQVPQFIYEVSSTATADFAAIMAKSSRIFKTIDPKLSQKCIAAAQKAYNYLSKHPDIFPEGGFKNPADTQAGGYSDAYDKDERIWAAAEMYLATGKKAYLNDFNALNTIFKSQFSETSWINPSALGFYSLLLAPETKQIKALQSELKEGLGQYCQAIKKIALQDGFGIGMQVDDYNWGSNAIVLYKAMNLILADHVLGDEESRHIALNHLDYIFGMNPNKVCYVTGVGTKRVLHLHHAPSVADLIAEPIPGILTGGPNKYRYDEALQNEFSEDVPPARIFLDNEESYSSNENTIYSNAALVFVATYFNKL